MMELPYIEGVYSDIESIKLWLILYVCVLSRFSRVQLSATPWTVAVQAPLSMVFSRQEYWSECPSPGDLPHPGMEPIFSNVTCIGRRVLYHFLYHLICPGFWKCTLLITCRKQCRMFPAAAAKPLQSCLTLWPHRRQPTRLPRPWDSPGKNTGVGCHFLLQCVKVKSESEVVQSCPTLSDPMDHSLPSSSIHGIFHAVPLPSLGCLLLEALYLEFILKNWLLWTNDWPESQSKSSVVCRLIYKHENLTLVRLFLNLCA